MPLYLERLVAQMTALQPAAVLSDLSTTPPDALVLDDAESQRRARKLKRVSW